jgi:CDP-paratose 2-epimerase
LKVIITGVCGFIGTHTAAKLLRGGHEVVGCDNLSRAGGLQNLQWLRDLGGQFQFVKCDLRDELNVASLVASNSDANAIVHLGAQVAVTTSVKDPKTDFYVNALGTLNLLEAARNHCPTAAFLFSSTNKVYGQLDHLEVASCKERYEFKDQPNGVDESTPLEFHSPYGCSKGAADQYVLDYSRIYGLRSVVFRQSCIFGTRQFGIEDQGWVAWFAICSSVGMPLTIYGDGKQIRDLLWIDDLVDLYIKAIDRIDRVNGNAYNIGGGPTNTLSILELVGHLNRLLGKTISCNFAEWRPGDQKVYISNTAKAQDHLDWRPTVCPEEGLERLLHWAAHSEQLLREVLDGLPVLENLSPR